MKGPYEGPRAQSPTPPVRACLAASALRWAAHWLLATTSMSQLSKHLSSAQLSKQLSSAQLSQLSKQLSSASSSAQLSFLSSASSLAQLSCLSRGATKTFNRFNI
eukprot:365902-Chlamydomonas_euryale.AAC.8